VVIPYLRTSNIIGLFVKLLLGASRTKHFPMFFHRLFVIISLRFQYHIHAILCIYRFVTRHGVTNDRFLAVKQYCILDAVHFRLIGTNESVSFLIFDFPLCVPLYYDNVSIDTYFRDELRSRGDRYTEFFCQYLILERTPFEILST